jgi:hypothetical protein
MTSTDEKYEELRQQWAASGDNDLLDQMVQLMPEPLPKHRFRIPPLLLIFLALGLVYSIIVLALSVIIH